jgi:hypothetical protein
LILSKDSIASSDQQAYCPALNFFGDFSLQIGDFDLSAAPVEFVLFLLGNTSNDLYGCLVNCSGNGVCRYTVDNKFICGCKDKFKGLACEVDQHPCASSPCINDGSVLFLILLFLFFC